MKKTIFLCVLLFCTGSLKAADAPNAPGAPDAAKTYAAARHIRAGEEITADALREVPADPKALSAGFDELSGVEAVRPIRAGEIVTRLMVRPVRAVRPGDKIKVGTVTGRLKVSIWFIALQGGAKGETIEARNQASGRVCQVKVERPGEGSLAEAKK